MRQLLDYQSRPDWHAILKFRVIKTYIAEGTFMNKLLLILSVFIILIIFVSSCAPLQSATATSIIYTSTPAPTVTPSSTATVTNTPQPTLTPTITPIAAANTIRVPEDQPTIQAGIDAAHDGDLVLVSPGVYTENVIIVDKIVTLASRFCTTGDEQFIRDTIIDGNGESVITVRKHKKLAGEETKIIGFTVQNGDDGISARGGIIQILNNRFLNNKDGVDYQNNEGLNSGNLYENNADDGIDLDGSTGVTIQNNIIRNNKDDGIEIRLHEYRGSTLNVIIRYNTISGNHEDGIQLIDYPDVTDRVFVIERNLIQENAQVGLGLMDNTDTNEDYRAASIPERILLINNTFTGNLYSVTGGANLIALNNLFLNSSAIGLKNVAANSIVANNLFWHNGTDSEGSNIDPNTNLFTDPLLNTKYQIQQDSPAIDHGIALFEWKGEIVLNLPSSDYLGAAPDLGAYETNFTQAHGAFRGDN